VREFGFYISSGDVRRQQANRNIAVAAARDALERLEFAERLLGKERPKYVLENAYEAIRELIDAVMEMDGFKSYSHEASIAYLGKLGCASYDISAIDNLRRRRNGSKYYGEDTTAEEARQALIVAGGFKKRLQTLLEKRMRRQAD
jgi:hypothetical protein